jgi:hypothetical protein
MNGRRLLSILLIVIASSTMAAAQPPLPRPVYYPQPVQTFPAQTIDRGAPIPYPVAGGLPRQDAMREPVLIQHPDQIESQLKSLAEQFGTVGMIDEARAAAAIGSRVHDVHFQRLLQAHQMQPDEPIQKQIVLRVQMAEYQVTPVSLQLLADFVGNPRLADSPQANRGLSGVYDPAEINGWLGKLEREGFLQTSCRSQATILNGRSAQLKFAPEAKTAQSVKGNTGAQRSDDASANAASFIGTTLEASAVILQNDIIALSLIVENTTSSVAEGTSSRRIQSNTEIRDGQTLVLAGLTSAGTLTEVTRVPVLGDIPVMGRLFSSRKTSAIETELVVVITPEIIALPPARPNAVQQATHMRPAR